MADELLDYYARRAREYEAVYEKPERQADLVRVRAWLRSELCGRRVLEIACGTGYWTAWLAPACASIVATDAVCEVLALARAKPVPPGRVSFATADAFALETVPGEFDAAFAGFFWSHVPRDRIDAFLAGVRRRLGPGARLVLLDNRYVEGSSTPISRTDAAGDTWQRRRLADGTAHDVLKNFPAADEVRERLARLSHRFTAAAADPSVLAGRTPCGRLDVVSATPSPPSGACALPGQRLDALASRIGETCGLATHAHPARVVEFDYYWGAIAETGAR